MVAVSSAPTNTNSETMRLLDRLQVERISLFDANCQLGPSDLLSASAPISIDRLVSEMDRYGISEALLYHSTAVGYSPLFGNERLLVEISDAARLHACWVVLPHHTGEIGAPNIFVQQLLATGGRAVRMFPAKHRFSLSEWSVQELFGALGEHQIPLFLDLNRSHWSEDLVDYDQVYRICNDFKNLPVVLVREGIGSTRFLYPLLERFDNLYLEISYYQSAGGLEDISRRFGVGHLLFGTGLPTYSAGPPISMLLYADLSAEEKRMIGGDNLRNLLQKVS